MTTRDSGLFFGPPCSRFGYRKPQNLQLLK